MPPFVFRIMQRPPLTHAHVSFSEICREEKKFPALVRRGICLLKVLRDNGSFLQHCLQKRLNFTAMLSLHEILTDWAAGKNTRNIIAWQQSAIANPKLYQYLSWQYAENFVGKMLKANSRLFPAAVLPAPDIQKSNPDSILGTLDTNSRQPLEQPFQMHGELYLQKQKELLPGLWNGMTYRMTTLTITETIKLNCALGNYFQTLKSCDILEFELLAMFRQRFLQVIDFYEFTEALKLRSILHQQGNPLTFDCGRNASIGISTFIIYAEKNSYRALLRTVYPQNMPGRRILHTVPSMMMQPVSNAFEEEFSVTHNVYREYLEEIFEISEVEVSTGKNSFDYFYEFPDLQLLQMLETEGSAELYLTGIAFDLLKLRPEICILLFIKDPAWIENHRTGKRWKNQRLSKINIDEPFSAADFAAGRECGRLVSIQLGKEFEFPNSLLKTEYFTPPGIAAVMLGIEMARNAVWQL